MVKCDAHGQWHEMETWSRIEIVWFTDGAGRRSLRHMCPWCGRRSNGMKSWKVPDAYTTGRYREVLGEPISYPICEVKTCEQPGMHIHHLAPSNTFGDEADDWPTMNVCQRHHDEWHRKMHTYDRYQRREA